MRELKYKFLFEYEGTVKKAYSTSDKRFVAPIIDGSFEGENFKGKIVHGADYFMPIGCGIIPDVKLLMETEDGHRIYMEYQGIMDVSKTEDGLPNLRTTPKFSAPAPYEWLNDIVCVGVATSIVQTDEISTIKYEVYQIL